MGEILILIRTLLVGALLGGMFYGGLWWTVRRAVSIRHIGVWVSGSFLLRTSIAVGGLYFATHGDWRALLACLLGFLMARICVTRLTRAPPEPKGRLLEGFGP